MSGHFIVKSKKKLADMLEGDRIETSDYAQITPEGFFVQLEYKEGQETRRTYKVKPGVWTIQKNMVEGIFLDKTSFSTDELLNTIDNTQEIRKRIDCFFKNIHRYKELGFDVARRNMIIYGPPGTGKTSTINKIAQDYTTDGATAVIIWTTDKFESYEVKDFVKSFEYTEGVQKIVLIIEDLGGVEIDQSRMQSDSSLLSLLDNQEKIFKIPTLILATTNYPENFLGNLMNRPQRFDDKLEIPLPGSEDRKKLLSFFTKGAADEDSLSLIGSKQCDKFSTAHIRGVFINSEIYSKSLKEAIKDAIAEIALFEKAFQKNKRNLGIE